MNAQMAYLIGMILGNGEIQRTSTETKVTIDIPFKKIIDDEGRDIATYVKASLFDISQTIGSLVGSDLESTTGKHAIKLTFTKNNQDYTIREIMRFIGNGVHHKTMKMSPDLFDCTVEEKRELLRGFCDVTGHIRKSNIAFGVEGSYRVYIEIPGNWEMVIDIANMLKDLDVPVQSIDFGHPNFRDSNLKNYNAGKPNYWKKEHQIKIYANEFLPIGFNIEHKQRALETLAADLLTSLNPVSTHKFYWEKTTRVRTKPVHPGENDMDLPASIRGKHYESWAQLAGDLGYHE